MQHFKKSVKLVAFWNLFITLPCQTSALWDLTYVVPKHDGGWHIMYHLSTPDGFSINNFIDSAAYLLSYCSINDAFSIINKLVPGALLSKIDLQDAFRLIPADWNLLGIFWRQKFYIDTCLPFGLRSAPFLLTVFHLHYTGF